MSRDGERWKEMRRDEREMERDGERSGEIEIWRDLERWGEMGEIWRDGERWRDVER